MHRKVIETFTAILMMIVTLLTIPAIHAIGEFFETIFDAFEEFNVIVRSIWEEV